MKKILLLLALTITLFSFTACNKNIDAHRISDIKENFYQSGSDDENYVELHRITEKIWVHTTYSLYNGSRTPSNGLIAISSEGIILVDTPWSEKQTEELLHLAEKIFDQPVTIAIITHAHEDTIGGINTLLNHDIDVRSTGLTVTEAQKNGYLEPQPKLDSEPVFTVGDTDIETYYPGEGHSPDNITVWFPQSKVLFGGCLIKSLGAKDKGSIIDASVEQWPQSIKNVMERYPDAEVVVPGHGQWGNLDLLQHTLTLVSE